METKEKHTAFLNNSAYLRNMFTETQKFNKTEQIMIEEPLTIHNPINQTLRIKPMSSKRISQAQFDQNFQYTLLKCHQAQGPEEIGNNKAREPIQRLCRRNFPLAIQEYNTNDTLIDEKWRKKRDVLAAKAKVRKENAFKSLREKVHQILVFQLTEQTQSQIQQQTFEQQEMKQIKVQNFILRQQFATKQKDILRQMREFCQYGTIKLE